MKAFFELAAESGLTSGEIAGLGEKLICFAMKVAEQEREACMQACYAVEEEYEGDPVHASWCADKIRERNKA